MKPFDELGIEHNPAEFFDAGTAVYVAEPDTLLA